MSCQRVFERDLIERYVRGGGTRAEREAFELHYFECQACFEKVRACRLLRSELQPAAAPGPRRPDPSRSRRRFRWTAALVASVAAVAVGITWWSQRPRAPVPPPAPAAPIPGPAAPAAPEAVLSLAELARVVPPRYDAPRLRGTADEATQLFRDGMMRYAAADYAGAVPALERAAAIDPQAPDPPFYLGICRLMLGDAAAAVRHLGRAARLGAGAPADEARFYLAKAHLALNELEAARRELGTVAAGAGEHAAEARGILEALGTTGAAGR